VKRYFAFEDIKNNSKEEDLQKWFYAINRYEQSQNYHLESPTISKMIEFLHTHGEEGAFYLVGIKYIQKQWLVMIEVNKKEVTYSDYELIDALWGATKEVLACVKG